MATKLCTLAFTGVAAAVLGAPGALAIPQKEFEQWKANFAEARQGLLDADDVTRAKLTSLFNEHMERLDVASLKPSQWNWLAAAGMIDYSHWEGGQDFTDAAMKTVRKRKSEPGAEGAAAAAMYAQLSISADTSEEHDVRVLTAALTHPGLDEALRAGAVSNLNRFLAYQTHPKVQEAIVEEMLGYAAMLEHAGPEMAMYTGALYDDLLELAEGRDDALERVRQGLLRLTSRAETLLAQDDAPDVLQGETMASRAHERLEMAPKIAALVGNPAPPIDFLWDSRDDIRVKTLSDLQGKVVVLDFWATWCGPCVASFPKVRQLADHYEGYPVEIVGVTSLQGSTSFPERGNVSAETPEQEFAQMEEYIQAKDITWTIAFSEADVFNPEYGVRGIPHVAIIDPDGVLRYRGLHPGTDLAGKVEKINGLLEEFNMPHPERPIEE